MGLLVGDRRLQRWKTKLSVGRAILLVGFGALVAVLFGTALACAAPAWRPPVRLGDTGKNSIEPKPAFAFNAAGEAVAVWERSGSGSDTLQGVSRSSRGAWSAPVALSGRYGFQPQVAINVHGEAVAVWGSGGRNAAIQSATRSPRGTWSRPVAISTKGGDASGPQVAINARGEAVAVWRNYNGKNVIVQSASRRPNGAWSRPVALSEKGQSAEGPRVGIDAAGEAVAVWRRFSEARGIIIESASRPRRGIWSAPTSLSGKGKAASGVQIAVNVGGEAVAVWQTLRGERPFIQGAVRRPSGVWSRPADLSERGQDASLPQVALNASGEAIAVWRRFVDKNSVIESASRSHGNAWSSPTAVSPQGRSLSPQIAIDGAGEAVAIWERFTGGNPAIESASLPPGGAWSASAVLSPGGEYPFEDPQIGIDRAGEAVALWQRALGPKIVVESASLPPGGT
jgi:hypothetical protein